MRVSTVRPPAWNCESYSMEVVALHAASRRIAWGNFAGCRLFGAAGPRNAKTPAKPGKNRESQGSKRERLRSESNRRWRICNQAAVPVNPEENAGFQVVDPIVDPTAEADPELTEVAAAWETLPPAIRAGILAMVRSSRT